MQTPKPLLPEGARRTAAWCGVVLLVTGVAAVAVWLCVVFKTAVTPVLLALLGTALLGPVHRRMTTHGVNRSLAAAVTCAVLIAVVGGAGYIVVAALVETGDQIVQSLKDAGQWVVDHFQVADDIDVNDLEASGRKLVEKFGATAAGGLLTGLSVVGSLIATAALALLLTFFFLRDADRAVGLALPRPARYRRHGRGDGPAGLRGRSGLHARDDAHRPDRRRLHHGRAADPAGAGRGGARRAGAGRRLHPVSRGVHLRGRGRAGGPRGPGFAIALWALGVVLAVQVLEGHILQPMIQSRTVQMHPAMILIALTAGASVAGILGMLLAVPLCAAAFGIIGELRRGGRIAPDG